MCCIVCEDCGMQTPCIPIGDNKNAALDKAGEIWNQRLNRPAATEGDLLDLIRKEITPVDAPYVLTSCAHDRRLGEARADLRNACAENRRRQNHHARLLAD